MLLLWIGWRLQPQPGTLNNSKVSCAPPVKISCPLPQQIRSIFSITLLCCSFAAGLPGLSARRCEIIRVYEIWGFSAAPEWKALMFDEKEEAAQSQDIFLQHDEVMESRVQFLSACLFFCFFFMVWSPIWHFLSSVVSCGNWMVVHLPSVSPLAANVVNWVL